MDRLVKEFKTLGSAVALLKRLKPSPQDIADLGTNPYTKDIPADQLDAVKATMQSRRDYQLVLAHLQDSSVSLPTHCPESVVKLLKKQQEVETELYAEARALRVKTRADNKQKLREEATELYGNSSDADLSKLADSLRQLIRDNRRKLLVISIEQQKRRAIAKAKAKLAKVSDDPDVLAALAQTVNPDSRIADTKFNGQ